MKNLIKFIDSTKPLLVYGLGNYPKKYTKNRHNAGRNLLLHIKRELDKNFLAEESEKKIYTVYSYRKLGVKLFLPNCYMNESGAYLNKFLQQSPLNEKNLLIIHDDLDIPLGKFKFHQGKGPKAHNGIDSIEKTLGTKDFARLRIGIENRENNRISGKDYVLLDFSVKEMPMINKVNNEIATEILNYFLSLHSFIHK